MPLIQYPALNAEEQIYITEIDTVYLPGHSFTAQLCKFPEDLLYEIHGCIQENPEANPKSPLNVGDEVYVSLENTFCRAEILKTGENECLLDLVDFGYLKSFGNSEIFTLQPAFCSKWDRISVHVVLKEDRRIHLGLQGKLKISGHVTVGQLKYVCGNFDELVLKADEDALAHIRNFETNMTQDAVVRQQPELKQLVLAQPELNDVVIGFIAVAQMETKLYGLQLKKFDIEAFEKGINEIYNDPKNQKLVTHVESGQYGVTQYGSQFCRALVIEPSGDEAKIVHIDYGSMEFVKLTNFYELIPGLASDYPWMAITCECQQELEVEKEYTLKIVSTYLDDDGIPTYAVELCSEDSILVQKNDQKECLPQLEIQSEKITLYSVCQDGLYLAVQLGQYSVDQLVELNLKLTEHIKKNSSHKPTMYSPGDLVALEIEENFYRGVVSKIDGSTIWVYQVDFGLLSEARLTDIQPFPREFINYPQIGFRCLLSPSQLNVAAQESFVVRNLRKVSQVDYVDIYEFDLVENENETSGVIPEHPSIIQGSQIQELSPSDHLFPQCAVNFTQGEFDHRENDPAAEIVPTAKLQSLELNPENNSSNSIKVESCATEPDEMQQPFQSTENHVNSHETCFQFANSIKYPEFGPDPEKVNIQRVHESQVGIQFCRFGVDVLHEIECKLRTFVENHPNLEPVPVTERDLVISCDADGYYYRAEVLKIEGDHSLVMCIDYGKPLTGSARMIRLPKEFEEEPRVGATVDKTFHAVEGEELYLILGLDGNKLLAETFESVCPEETVTPSCRENSEIRPPANGQLYSEKRVLPSVVEFSSPCESRCVTIPSKTRGSFATFDEELYANQFQKHPNNDEADVDCIDSVRSSFSLDSDLLETDIKLSVQRDPEEVCSEMSFVVVVTSIHRPTKVCVVKRRWLKAAKSIGESLTNRAGNLQPVVASKLEMGSVVVAKLTTDPARFRRARVAHYNRDTELYKVFLVDSGVIVRLPLSNLFQLPGDMVLSKTPGFALILKVLADELSFDHKAINDIYSGVLRCTLTFSNSDDIIPGEKCYQASLWNKAGNVLNQLHMEGVVTIWTERFPRNPVLVPCHSETAFLDAQVVSFKTIAGTSQTIATLIVIELQERIQRVMIAKEHLKPLYASNPEMPAIAHFEHEPHSWKRARVTGRPQPGKYSLYLVDIGIEIMHPVAKTFKCPGNLLHIPEAAVEVQIETQREKIPENIENGLIVIKTHWSIDDEMKSPSIEAYDHDGNLLFN